MNRTIRNVLAIAVLPLLLAAGCACKAAPSQTLETKLERVLAAWARGDRTLAGYAAKGARIDFEKPASKPKLVYYDACKLKRNRTGACTGSYDGGDGGYAHLIGIHYHQTSGGRLVVDSIRFEGTAG